MKNANNTTSRYVIELTKKFTLEGRVKVKHMPILCKLGVAPKVINTKVSENFHDFLMQSTDAIFS